MTNSTQATISIPFNVKTIKVKQILYSSNSLYTLYFYQVLTSNLFNSDEPLGLVLVGLADAGSQLTSNSEIVKEFVTPVNISGTYTFNLSLVDGSAGGSLLQDYCVLLLEFNSDSNDE